MKKNILHITALAISLGFGIAALESCKLKNPVEGFAISIKADALTAPNTVRVIDAATGAQADLPANYEVKITGPGASLVYTPGGSRKITVMQGLLLFSLRKGTQPTPENPIKFNIEIVNTKYLDLVYPVTITSLNNFSQTISLVNFSNPPAGSSAESKSISTGSDGKTTASETISLPSVTGKTEAATMTLASGTQLLDADGNPVSGSVETKVLHSTPSGNSLLTFPGGTNSMNLKDTNGTSLPNGSLDPIGWANISMSAGGKDVSSFSNPVNFIMEISDSLINPATGIGYKVGDMLNVYSRSEGENFWVLEGQTPITKNSITNKLEANLSITHLSSWTAGSFMNPCGLPLVLTINNPNNRAASVNSVIYAPFSSWNFVKGEYNMTVPANATNYKLVTNFVPAAGKVYDHFIDFRCGSISGTTTRSGVVLCNSTSSTDIPNGATAPIDFNIVIKCANGSQVLLPDNYTVYYIKENDYQNTIVPANGNVAAHKIDPADGTVGSIAWSSTSLRSVTENNQSFNKVSFAKGVLEEGQKYRFSVYYNDGSKTSREDFVTETFYEAVMGVAGGYAVPITLKTCPL